MVKGVMALAAASLLAACSAQAVDRCDSAAKPYECRAWRDGGGSLDDYFAGAMTGYLLSRVLFNGQPQYVVVRDPGYRGQYRPLRSNLRSRQDQLVAAQRRTIQRQRAELRRVNEQRAAAKRAAAAPKAASSGKSLWGSGNRPNNGYKPGKVSYGSRHGTTTRRH